MTREEFMQEARETARKILAGKENGIMNMVQQAWAEGKRNAEKDAFELLKEQQETVASLQNTICKLNSALGERQEQKRGHWMYGWTCSVCNERLRISLDGRAPIFEGIKCCPNCGAKMEAANETD